MRRTALLLTLVLAWFPLGNGWAQTDCSLGDTIGECWTKVVTGNVESELEEQGEDAAADSKEELQSKPTGVETGGLNLGSNTKNLLPLLALSGLLGNTDSNGNNNAAGTLAFDLNFLVPGLAEDKNSQLQLGVNTDPVIPENLKAALPDENRDELVAALEGELANLDHYILTFNYSWTDSRRGRGFEQYRRRFASLVRAATKPVYEEFRTRSETFPNDLLIELLKKDSTITDATAFKDAYSNVSDQQERKKRQQELLKTVEDAARATGELDQAYGAALDAAGLDWFADLVNNQPQLFLSARQQFRDQLLGGDETSLGLTYEWGSVSLNTAMDRSCHEAMDTALPSQLSPATLQTCLEQYKAFVDRTRNQTAMSQGNRFSFSAEYLETDDQQINRPDLGVTDITLTGAKKLMVSVGWSRLWRGGSETEPIRLDFQAKYEDVSDDPMRRDRAVGTLTFSRRFGGIAVPFGIVFANHGEFLTDVDQKLSAHIGLKFNLFGGADAGSEDSSE